MTIASALASRIAHPPQGPQAHRLFGDHAGGPHEPAGASLLELLVTTALIGVVTAISAPTFYSYVHAGALRAGAEELSGLMSLARSLAIKENTRVCVNRDTGGSNRIRL